MGTGISKHPRPIATTTSTFPIEGKAKVRERGKTSSEAGLPKKVVPILSFLLNFITQLICKEILSVDHQELCLLHADHRGPPDCGAQKAHFLGEARTKASVTSHSVLQPSSLPLEIPLGPLQTPIHPPTLYLYVGKRQQV